MSAVASARQILTRLHEVMAGRTHAQHKLDRVVEIIEKPTNPPTSYAVTGCYFYDSSVFDIINALEPSKRGELEITDVNSAYIERGSLRHHLVDGWWTDAGTVTSLYRAGTLVAAEHGNAVLRQMRPEGEASNA